MKKEVEIKINFKSGQERPLPDHQGHMETEKVERDFANSSVVTRRSDSNRIENKRQQMLSG